MNPAHARCNQTDMSVRETCALSYHSSQWNARKMVFPWYVLKRKQVYVHFTKASFRDCSCTTGEVAGVFYVRDFKAPLPEDFSMDLSPSLVAAINCVHKVDELYEQQRPNLQVGDCVDLWLLGVNPSFQRRGVAKLLTEGAINLLRTKHFKYIVLESSGEYSAKCAAACGMACRASVTYTDHEPTLAGDKHASMGLWELEVNPR
jgi:GNAT superfamily N-acetyltransferase